MIFKLFLQNLAASQFGYGDPETLKSIYSNYEEGLDREFIDMINTHGDDEAAIDDWKQRMRAERKARGDPWTPEVDGEDRREENRRWRL